ncbi:MAG: thioredoxin family protein [Alcanivorax sp.]|nr:thioredoxin family protein [Alcanivorax sp.]
MRHQRRIIAHCLTAFLVLCAALLAVVASADDPARSGSVSAPHIRAELFSDVSAVAPGDTLTVALRLQPDEGWHTYWLNPGDSGLETRIRWTLPEGASAGSIQWPTPERIPVEHLVNYGFKGDTLLLVDITVPVDLDADTDTDTDTGFTLTADASWLVCEAECIPGDASLSLTLPVADISTLSQHTALFRQGRDSQPLAADWPTRFVIHDTYLEVRIQAPEDMPSTDLHFFAGAAELVEHAEPQTVAREDGALVIRQPLNLYFNQTPEHFAAVLRHDPTDGSASAWLLAARNNDQVAEAGQVASAPAPTGLWLALLLALGGGVLLNLMPCVFPVLSLKALSLTRSSAQRSHALAYTAGVLLCFIAIAGLLLALRAGGAALGWGFQLQSPPVVGALAYLMFALGLGLTGMVQLGAGWMGVGQRLTHGSGLSGSFFTGVLAVVVASPCTAPFMGTALGYAVTQPAPVALSVFAALGFGLALPFLLIGFIPALARALPKPGAWMDTFKQAMAFPLFLTSVWLLWVLGRQTGADGMAMALAGLVALALAMWLWGLAQQQGSRNKRIAAVALLLLAVWPLWSATRLVAPTAEAGSGHAQPWSAETLAALRADGQPVLVNMTADWCITCLANERVALDTDTVRNALTAHGVTYLKGDWTRQDPAITDYLAGYGRNGVPLYVLYPQDGGAPRILPQVLTPGLVSDALAAAAGQAASEQP